jgi:hypothetical protein
MCLVSRAQPSCSAWCYRHALRSSGGNRCSWLVDWHVTVGAMVTIGLLPLAEASVFMVDRCSWLIGMLPAFPILY